MSEYAGLAHIHAIGQDTNRETLQAFATGHFERGAQDRSAGLLPFTQGFLNGFGHADSRR